MKRKLNNWGLRLIALLLAIVLYHALKDTAVKENGHITNDRSISR